MDKKLVIRAYGCAIREIETRDEIIVEVAPLGEDGAVRAPERTACAIQGGYGVPYSCKNIDCHKPKACKAVTENGWVKCKCEDANVASGTQPV